MIVKLAMVPSATSDRSRRDLRGNGYGVKTSWMMPVMLLTMTKMKA